MNGGESYDYDGTEEGVGRWFVNPGNEESDEMEESDDDDDDDEEEEFILSFSLSSSFSQHSSSNIIPTSVVMDPLNVKDDDVENGDYMQELCLDVDEDDEEEDEEDDEEDETTPTTVESPSPPPPPPLLHLSQMVIVDDHFGIIPRGTQTGFTHPFIIISSHPQSLK